VVNHIQALTKAKAQIPNPNFQTTKDGFIVFGIWSLELGISMFFLSECIFCLIVPFWFFLLFFKPLAYSKKTALQHSHIFSYFCIKTHSMNIILLGSGGREHALAWKIAASERCEQLFIAPGNAGTADCGKNIDLDYRDTRKIADFIRNNKISMLVVGPEIPLVEGLKDALMKEDLPADFMFIGPDKQAAQLEGSKDFAKKFMQQYQIPTAAYKSFTAAETAQAKAFLQELKPPYVLKADGLAAGKGVLILDSLNEANSAVEEILQNNKFGEAGNTLLIEEFLKGIELSVFVLTDGKDYIILPEAKDYKRIGEGDTGLNTGGMGSVSPVPFADKDFMQKVEERIIRPSIQGIAAEKMDYTGFLFIGLMNVQGNPYVIEYNVRLGDPETESVLPRIESDLTELMQAAAEGTLKHTKIEISTDFSVALMLVSGGYPEAYRKKLPISFSENIADDILLFHAGTTRENDMLLTNGGRVIAVNARASSLQEAKEKAYKAAEKIHFEDCYYRNDIAKDLL
jgi:phosphoribosylamine--glycine ligase